MIYFSRMEECHAVLEDKRVGSREEEFMAGKGMV